MVAPAQSFHIHYARHCPQLACGERLADSPTANSCSHCGLSYRVCVVCQATNRVLAGFCRACRAPRSSLVWAHHAGLRDERMKTVLPQSFGATSFYQLGAEVLAAPLAADGIIIIADSAGDVTLIDERLAKKIGSFKASAGAIKVTPAYASGMLFVATETELLAFDLLDALDGETDALSLVPVWRVEAKGIIKQPPIRDEQNVYFVHETQPGGSHSHNVMLTACRQLDGAQLWSVNFAEASKANLPAVLFNGTICLVADAGHVFLVERDTGKYEFFKLEYQIDAQVTPFVSGNRVLIVSEGGRVFEIVKEPRGTLVNQLHDHETRVTTIAAGDGYIVLGHTSGVTLLGERGKHKWSCTTIESVSVTPLPMQNGFLAIDDAGSVLLFHTLQANPIVKQKFITETVYTPPIATAEHFIVASYEGRVGFIRWQ